MLKGLFDGVPTELAEAATIDGATRWRAFRLVVPCIAVLPAILLFVVLQRFIVGAFVAGALKG
jgi:ABC-type maltose transport system permease subunit